MDKGLSLVGHRGINCDDESLGDKMAMIIGDTFINFMNMSPVKQWAWISCLLRQHGFKVVQASDSSTSQGQMSAQHYSVVIRKQDLLPFCSARFKARLPNVPIRLDVQPGKFLNERTMDQQSFFIRVKLRNYGAVRVAGLDGGFFDLDLVQVEDPVPTIATLDDPPLIGGDW